MLLTRPRTTQHFEHKSTQSARMGGRICLHTALWITLLSFLNGNSQQVQQPEEKQDSTVQESRLLSGTRQLTFAGRRSGESYFSPDGSSIIFQSERDAENPFFQIYTMDLEMGDLHRVSPGTGKTTCAWFHPSMEKVLFASTHLDPDAPGKQKEELEFRDSGQARRYSWDYDEHYDLFESDLQGQQLQRLTTALGYDAEASWSPDGRSIVFSSNRHAHGVDLPDNQKELFELDPSSQVDIYVMDSDGSNVRRLTETLGYDGGPFFSPDGTQIVWRRFSEDGATAEIYRMQADGSRQVPLTGLEVMSWAPFFHPSGDYLVFATNLHGFGNFEVYLVDSEGQADPVRVTFTDGFDGLPAFHPDGSRLAWTSNRSGGISQIFTADWNDREARRLLGLDIIPPMASDVVSAGRPDLSSSEAAITPADLRLHVEYLASDELEGRFTGSHGERLATQYVADVFARLGLAPAGENGTYFQDFEFTAGVSLGEKNQLVLSGETETSSFQVDQDWRPLAFSQIGEIPASQIVFAGYGIVAPAKDDFEEYDSYTHLDVTDKWVLALRYLPEEISQEFRQHLSRFSSLRYKTMAARDRGARGILFVSGPASQVKEELVQLKFDASLSGTSTAALSITDQVARQILRSGDKDLAGLQEKLDSGDPMMGFSIAGLTLTATVDILQEKRMARNVLARLYAGDQPAASAVAVGGHVDHLGFGTGTTSLAKPEEVGDIHHGADDNASGTAGVMEIAQYLASLKQEGRLPMRRDILFGVWSGEELGILGSSHFVNAFIQGRTHAKSDDLLSPDITAYLNLDMVGRLDKSVVMQGTGSSSVWPSLIERANAPIGLPIVTQSDSYLPTDATAFFLKGVPVLSAFTGAHSEYHTPRDTTDRINFEGAAQIARFMALTARNLAADEDAPDYIAQSKPQSSESRSGIRVYLGTVPDYAGGDVVGVLLSGVSKDGPAEAAGVRGGDVVVELAGRKIENIYDYTYALDALKIGEESDIVVLRDGEQIRLKITPRSRD